MVEVDALQLFSFGFGCFGFGMLVLTLLWEFCRHRNR